MKDYALLLGRLFLAAIFIYSGFRDIGNFDKVAERMANAGMPLPGLFLVGAIFLKLVGGFLMVLGIWSRTGALMLIVFLIPTTLIFHTNFAEQTQITQFFKNLGLIGGLLFVWAFGPGRIALQTYFDKSLRKGHSD